MSKTMSKSHLEYWQTRADEILRYVDRTDIDVFGEIAKMYNDEAVAIQKELYNFVMKYSEDGLMTYQEALERLRGTDLSDYQANANKYRMQAEKDPELLKRLNAQYVSAKATRLDALYLEMTWRAGVLSGKLNGTFDSYLKKTASYAYRKIMGGHSGAVNVPALEELARTPLKGDNYSKQIWKNTDTLADDLRSVLKKGFVRGENSRVLAQELAKKYNVSRARAQTLIRTDGTAVISNSVAKRYLDAGLTYYRVHVHLDARTSETCREIAKENKRYRLDEMEVGVNAPPFHFNCRTAIIPDTEEIGGDVESQAETQKQKTADNSDVDKIFEEAAIEAKINRANALRQGAVEAMEKTNMASSVGLANYNQFLDRFDIIKDEQQLKLYQKLGSKIEYAKLKGSRNYAQGHKVHLTQRAFDGKKTKDGHLYQFNPLSTVFHENGHALDYLGLDTLTKGEKVAVGQKEVKQFGKKAVVSIFATHASGLPQYDLKNVIRRDLWTYINDDLPMLNDPNYKYKRGEKTRIKSQAIENFSIFKQEMLDFSKQNPNAVGAISDMVEATGWLGEYPFGVGHGKRYWKNVGSAETEFFAEVSELLATDSDGYAKVKEIFPNAVKTYHEIVDDILKGVTND